MQKYKTRRYKEGDWLAIPLDKGGYALGIIARANSKSDYLLGYFFLIRFSSLPDQEVMAKLTSKDSAMISWFSDIGIKEDKWQVIPNHKPFSRKDWPVPIFGRPNLVEHGKGFLIEYDQEEPISSQPIRETACNSEQLTDLPIDRKSGHLALVKKLSHLLQ